MLAASVTALLASTKLLSIVLAMFCLYMLYVKVKKERIVLREIHLRTTGRHLSNGITQCYLLPDRGDRLALPVVLP